MNDIRVQVTLRKKGEKSASRTFRGGQAQQIAQFIRELLDGEERAEKFTADAKIPKYWRNGHRFRKINEDDKRIYYRCSRCKAEVDFTKDSSDFQRKLTLTFHHMLSCGEYRHHHISKVMDS